jgi:hypothetical protein
VVLEIDRVKEIQRQNKEGIIPADLGEIKEADSKPVKVLDYENVVGQDSLTRLDERNRNKKKNKNRNKHKDRDRTPGAPTVVVQEKIERIQPEATKPNEGQKPEGQAQKNRNNRRFRPNRNKNRNNDQQNNNNESGS